jgi:ethanolamine utilization protein EutN
VIIAQVIGNIVATQKNDDYAGAKILIVQPLNLEGNPQGDELLAVDAVDAGPGDRVLVVQEGWSASYVVGKTQASIDMAVIGVIDEIKIYSANAKDSEESNRKG